MAAIVCIFLYIGSFVVCPLTYLRLVDIKHSSPSSFSWIFLVKLMQQIVNVNLLHCFLDIGPLRIKITFPQSFLSFLPWVYIQWCQLFRFFIPFSKFKILVLRQLLKRRTIAHNLLSTWWVCCYTGFTKRSQIFKNNALNNEQLVSKTSIDFTFVKLCL